MSDRASTLPPDSIPPTARVPPRGTRSALTLALCTLLHGFTHAYGTILVPLYLLMVADLRLGGVNAASLVVTVYGLVYCLGSYGAGILADRFDRKALLGVGLIGNAAAILLMGLTRRYELLLALGVLAGLAGTLFHPAANALATAHFPKNPGMAIGILGIGAGLGFFAGPQYAGWRAETAQWQFAHVANWQRPCVELGAAGLFVGFLFLAAAREARPGRSNGSGWLGRIRSSGARGNGQPDATSIHNRTATPPTPAEPPVRVSPTLRRRVMGIAAILGCRDFAGIAGISLVSIYMQKAHGRSAKEAGAVIGAMMLLSMVVNPIAVYVSPGRRRLPALVLTLVLSGLVVATVPRWPLAYAVAVLCAFQTFQLSTFAISDAAMLERVDPAVRGRVVGIFLTIAGTFASTGPWIMGFWTDALGSRAKDPLAYTPLFGVLGGMMVFATLCTPLIARLGKPDQPPLDPLTEVTPATLEVVG
jgi:MFS family permease